MRNLRESQSDRLLKLLNDPRNEMLSGIAYSDGWVRLPQIMALRIASYTRRISDLRKRGYNIICEKETVNGQVQTKYRIAK